MSYANNFLRGLACAKKEINKKSNDKKIKELRKRQKYIEIDLCTSNEFAAGLTGIGILVCLDFRLSGFWVPPFLRYPVNPIN